MSEMVERVAKAIERVELGNNWEQMASAAIDAMREPTETMLKVGSEYDCGPATIEVWHDMIDEALK